MSSHLLNRRNFTILLLGIFCASPSFAAWGVDIARAVLSFVDELKYILAAMLIVSIVLIAAMTFFGKGTQFVHYLVWVALGSIIGLSAKPLGLWIAAKFGISL